MIFLEISLWFTRVREKGKHCADVYTTLLAKASRGQIKGYWGFGVRILGFCVSGFGFESQETSAGQSLSCTGFLVPSLGRVTPDPFKGIYKGSFKGSYKDL